MRSPPLKALPLKLFNSVETIVIDVGNKEMAKVELVLMYQCRSSIQYFQCFIHITFENVFR